MGRGRKGKEEEGGRESEKECATGSWSLKPPVDIHPYLALLQPDDVDQAQRSKAEIKTAKGEREMRMGRDDKKAGY